MKRLLTLVLGGLLMSGLVGTASAQQPPDKPAEKPAEKPRRPGEKPEKPAPQVPPTAAQFAALLQDPNVNVRRGAAFALKYDLQSEFVIGNLIAAFRDTDEVVRYNAVDAVTLMTPKQSVPSLTQALHSADPNIRINSCRALGRINRYTEMAIPSLVFMLKDENFDARQAAADALRRIYHSNREY
jgi:HEAT repeat protein